MNKTLNCFLDLETTTTTETPCQVTTPSPGITVSPCDELVAARVYVMLADKGFVTRGEVMTREAANTACSPQKDEMVATIRSRKELGALAAAGE